MIKIDQNPHKKEEYFSGSITMAVAGLEKTEWEFDLVRTTNGSTQDRVELSQKDVEYLTITEKFSTEGVDAVIDILSRTVLANIKNQNVTFTPKNK